MHIKNILKLKSRNILVISGFLLLLLYVLCLLVSIDKGSSWNLFNIIELFNSDSLFFSSLYRDIFIDKNSVLGTNFTTTPNIFPSMLLYFVVRFFIHNLIWGQIINGLVLIFSLIIIFFQIIKRVVSENVEFVFVFSCSVFALFFIHCINSRDLLFSISWLMLPYHIGTFLVSLCSLILTMGYIKTNKNIYLFILFILNVLTVFSNKIYIVYFIVPITVTLLLFVSYKDWKCYKLIIINIISAISGIVLYEIIRKMEWFTVSTPPLFSFSNTKNSFKFFYHHFSGFFFEGNVKTLILIICSITLVLILLFLINNFKKIIIRKQANNHIYFYFVFVFTFSIVTLFSPAINGLYVDESCIRYNIFVLYFLILNFPIIVFQFFKNFRIIRISSILLLLILFVYGFIIICKKNIKEEINKISNYKPEIVKKLDKIYLSNGLKNGVADYWDARNSYMFNSYSARILAVDEGYNPYLLGSNKNLYFSKKKELVYNFVILYVVRNDKLLLEKFGNNAKKLLDEDDIAIYKVPEFSFDENLTFYFLPN